MLVAAALVLCACGCASRASGEKVRRALQRSATDPLTWGPLLGAAVVHAADWDEPISDWARDWRPVARNLGDTDTVSHACVGLGLASTAYFAWVPLECPLPPDDVRRKRLCTAATALAAEIGTTLALKQAIGRQRPKKGVHDAMPSGHAATLATANAITWRNIRRLRMPVSRKRAIYAGGGGLMLLNAWSRLEGGRHWPTDLLVGQALGNAIGVFTYEMMSPDARVRPFLRVEPRRGATAVAVGFSSDF